MDKTPWTVTQADREAAANEELRRLVASGSFPSCPPQVWMVEAVKPIRMGAHDDYPSVQAFAKHRHESQVELVEALREAMKDLTDTARRLRRYDTGAANKAFIAVARYKALLSKIGDAS